MKFRCFGSFFVLVAILIVVPGLTGEVTSVPLDSLKGISPLIELDPMEKVEGTNSIKISAEAPCRVTIGKFAGQGIDNFNLKTRVKLKTLLKEGNVILETLVKVDGRVYFSRAMDQKLSGDNDWQEIFTNFYFKAGESPDEISVNLILDGRGKVWVDDLKVLREKGTIQLK